MAQRNRQVKKEESPTKETEATKPEVKETPKPESKEEPETKLVKETIVAEKKKYKCVGCLSTVEEISISGKDFFYCKACGRREEIIKKG